VCTGNLARANRYPILETKPNQVILRQWREGSKGERSAIPYPDAVHALHVYRMHTEYN